MRNDVTTALLAATLALAGCGEPDPPEKGDEPLKVEDTVFGPLVSTPEKVGERTDAAAGKYRDSMNQRLEEDEGASRDEPAGD
jgi:hypothetical protein